MSKMKGLLLGLVLIMMCALTGCGKTTVNLNDYVTITNSGYDSMGIASYSFDKEAFAEDFADTITINKNVTDEIVRISRAMGETDVSIFLGLCVSCKLDNTANLSNGDIINLLWDCDVTKAEDYFNVELVYSDIPYTVEGLEELGSFNPYDYVEVSFSGISPNGTVTITPDTSRPEMSSVRFTVDKSNGVQNGETITVTAEIQGNINNFIETYGSILEETERQYVCDSLAHYVTSVDEISQDMMDKMIAQGDDTFRASVATSWDKPENLVSVTYAGNYFLSAKPEMNTRTNNYLYLVYQVQAINPSPNQTVDFYYYICFSDIIILEDGTCSVDLSNYDVPTTGLVGGTSFTVGRYRYPGYETLDALFNNCVVTNIDKFDYTTTFN